MLTLTEFDKLCINTAIRASSFSFDPSTKVGACIGSKSGYILGSGCNCFPNPLNVKNNPTWLNINLKYKTVIHAEMNAVKNVIENNFSLTNATCYTAAFDSNNNPVAIGPCSNCAKHLIHLKIGRIISIVDGTERPDWLEETNLTKALCKLTNVKYFEIKHSAL